MTPVLVLGLGNRLMMDDGVGVAVVEALARLEPPDRLIRYEVGETDFAYSLELALEANCLIVVDAVLRQGNPGDVSILPLPEVSSPATGISLHEAHFLDLLQQVAPGKAGVLIAIEPYRIDLHWGLSPTLNEAFDSIVARVRQVVGRLTPTQAEGQ